jgi:hypothetical protein
MLETDNDFKIAKNLYKIFKESVLSYKFLIFLR